MSVAIQRVNSGSGLVYAGKSFSSAQKVQKIEPVANISEAKDSKYEYYYNKYLKGDRKLENGSMKDFREAKEEQVARLDMNPERSVPLINRLQKRVLELDRATSYIRKLAKDMPEVNALCASATRSIDAMRAKAMYSIEALAKKEAPNAAEIVPVRCTTCGTDNYFTRKDYLHADGTPCRNCSSPL